MRLRKQGGKREDPKIELSGTIFVVCDLVVSCG